MFMYYQRFILLVDIKWFPKLNTSSVFNLILDRLTIKIYLHLKNSNYTQYKTLWKKRCDLLWLPNLYEKISVEDMQKLVCSIIDMLQWDISVHNSNIFLSHFYKFWKLYIHLCVRKTYFIAQLFLRLLDTCIFLCILFYHLIFLPQ